MEQFRSTTEESQDFKPGDVKLTNIYKGDISGLKIIGAEYNGRTRIYLVLVKEFTSLIYLAAYDTKKEKIAIVKKAENDIVLAVDERIISAKAYLINDGYIYFYILTTDRMLYVKINNKNLQGRVFVKREKHNLSKTENATMTVISGYPFLAGGSLGGYNGTYVALLGTYPAYYRYSYLSCARNNPILLQFQDYIFFIGGSLRPKIDPLVEYRPLRLLKKENMINVWYLYQYSWRSSLAYPIISYEEINLRTDALNATAFPYRTEIYIFTKQSFYYERTFYRYNILSNSWTIYEVDKEIYDERKLKKAVESIISVNVNNIGYIFLSGHHGHNFIIESFKFKPFF